MTVQFPNRYIPAILAIGVMIAIANYSLGFGTNLGSLLVIQVVTSFLVGYGLLLLIENADLFFPKLSGRKRWLVLIVAFCLLGILASEVEHLNRSLLFNQGTYRLGGGSGFYVFNALISVILGISFYYHQTKTATAGKNITPQATSTITQIPIRKGEGIELLLPEDILYFRAADNYCIAVDSAGDEHLCESTLSNLEAVLPKAFVRIHRSFLVHAIKIQKITPYGKQRFILRFTNGETIRTGGTYASVIRNMMRLSANSDLI